MPCSLFTGNLRSIVTKSSSSFTRSFIRQHTFIFKQQQPRRSLNTTTTTTTTIVQPWLGKATLALFLVGGGGVGVGMAMHYYSLDKHLPHTLQCLWRMGRVALVGFQVALDYQWLNVSSSPSNNDDPQRKEACHLRSAQRVLGLMQDLGGIYIKLGQHMSAMHYILPTAWTSTLQVLQDQCPVVSTPEQLAQLVFEETGRPCHQVFETVDWDHPIGVASLAQVHKAKLLVDDEDEDEDEDENRVPKVVAVKCQHPSIETYCSLDLQCVTAVVRAIQWWFPAFGFGWMVDEMNEALPQELDFTNEARHADQVRANFKDDPGALVIPKVMWATRRILCMEYIEGGRPDDLEYMKTHGIDPEQVASEITHLFSKMMFLHGFVHCDPHPGNLLIRPTTSTSSSKRKNFDVVLLDHGQYRTLTPTLRTDYAHLWTSLIKGDEPGIAHYAYKLGCRHPHHRLFASLLTGREWHTIVSSQGLATKRTSVESERVAGQTHLFLHKIADVLSSLPRTLLLLLKTSDLLRHLTHGTGTNDNDDDGGGGAAAAAAAGKSMVQCCNKAVWLDKRQQLWDRYSTGDQGWTWLGWWCRDYLVAWWHYSSLDWMIWLTP